MQTVINQKTCQSLIKGLAVSKNLTVEEQYNKEEELYTLSLKKDDCVVYDVTTADKDNTHIAMVRLLLDSVNFDQHKDA